MQLLCLLYIIIYKCISFFIMELFIQIFFYTDSSISLSLPNLLVLPPELGGHQQKTQLHNWVGGELKRDSFTHLTASGKTAKKDHMVGYLQTIRNLLIVLLSLVLESVNKKN